MIDITTRVKSSRAPLARKGLLRRALYSTNLLLAIPATVAAMLLTSVACPNMVDKSCDEMESVFAEDTSQDSKQEKRIAVENPPRKRPTKSSGRLVIWMIPQAMA